MDIDVREDTRIQTADLGDFHYRRFLKLAFVNRQTKAEYSCNTLRNRVDAETNQKLVQDGFEFYCKQFGMTEEELENLLTEADQNSISTVELLNRLSAGQRGEEITKRSRRGRKLQDE